MKQLGNGVWRDQRHVNYRYLKRECRTEHSCMLKSSLVATRPLLVNMKGRLRSISHHVLSSDFLEDCFMFWSDWALKEQSRLKDSVYLCVTAGEGEREIFEGPSPNLEPISMQMLRPDLEGSCHCLAWAGTLGLRCRNTQ